MAQKSFQDQAFELSDEVLDEAIEAFTAERDSRQAEQAEKAKAEVRELASKFKLRAADIFGNRRKADSGEPQEPKQVYVNPDDPDGPGWSGRGRKPQWYIRLTESGQIKGVEDLQTKMV